MTDEAGTAPGEPDRLAVCICTYKRPGELESLLARIATIAAECGDRATVSVVVVDDDPAASAKDVAVAASGAFDGGVTYDTTGSGDVAIARNRAIELGLATGDWLVLIDDDCVPDDGWLGALVDVRRQHAAECVSGACDTRFPPGTPSWLRDEPFVDERWTLPDGAAISVGYTKNTMLSAEFLRRTGLRFDSKFGKAGGEDAMFFYAADAAGLRHHFAAGAVVHEKLPPQRVTLSYQLSRRFWYGNTEAVTMLASGRHGRARVAAGGVKKIASGLARPLTRVAKRQRPHVRFALSEVLRGVGRILGAAGIRLPHR